MKNYFISFKSSQIHRLKPGVKERIPDKNFVEMAVDEEQTHWRNCLITLG